MIDGCQDYSAEKVCTNCVEGRYLKSAIECKDVTVVADCSKYDSNLNFSKCIECNATHYLSGSGTCTLRTKTLSEMANCQSLSLSGNICGVCKDGFKLAASKIECLTIPSNCATTSEANGALTCTKCTDKYYLSGGDCLQGTKENCSIFQANSDTCQTCNSAYYKDANGSCVVHLAIDNCDAYGLDQNSINVCTTCKNDFYPITLDNKCIDITSTISNCSRYATATTCLTCNTGHYLNASATACTAWTISNCAAVGNTGVCTTCNAGKVLYTDGSSVKSCISPYQLFQNCNVNNYSANSAVTPSGSTCSQCNDGSYGFDYNGLFVCYNSDNHLLAKVTGMVDGDKVTDCNKYVGKVCMECSGSKILKEPSTGSATCEATTTSRSTTLYPLYLSSVFKTYRNFQNNGGSADCDISGYDQNQDTLSDLQGASICLKAISTKLSVIELATSTTAFSTIDADDLSKSNAPVSRYPPVTATTDPATVLLTNCLYYNTITGPFTGCVKCKYGYSGPTDAKNFITACNVITSCTSGNEGLAL